jgi:thiol-disulfide isomerase/thioredoxin
MKLKKTIALLMAAVLAAGCSPASSGDAEKEDAPQETPAAAENIARYYDELPEENHFEVTDKETLTSMLSHGTAIVFLGFPECPWCQAYMPMLEEALSENEATCSYYNIYWDKENDRAYYDSIAQLLIDQNDSGEEIIQYDNDGLPRIYMPLVLFVEKGRITAFDNETCMEDGTLSPRKYWTTAKKAALTEKLSENIQRVAALQAENNAQGCDIGCKVGD